MKKTHKGAWHIGATGRGKYYAQICLGRVGTYPNVSDYWKDVTCKRCLKKKTKSI